MELISKTYHTHRHAQSTDKEDIYTKSEVLQMFRSLSNRIEELEHTVHELKKRNVKTNREAITKRDVIALLNDHDTGATPFINMEEIEAAILEGKMTLDENVLLDRDLQLDDLITQTITLVCEYARKKWTNDNLTTANAALPIMSFSEYNKNIMFIYGYPPAHTKTFSKSNSNQSYTNDITDITDIADTTTHKNTWTIFTNEHLQRMVQKIHVSLIAQCNQWRVKHLDGDKNRGRRTENEHYRYSDMVARICNTSPVTNCAMMVRIKKGLLEAVLHATEYILRN